MCVGWAMNVMAHPHVFLEASSNLVFNATELEYAHITLAYDEMYSTTFIQDYDKDKDGLFDLDEISAIEDLFAQYQAQNYFSDLRLDGVQEEVNTIEGFDAYIVEGKVHFEYDIPLHIKLDTKVSIEWSVYDPEYLHEIEFNSESLFMEGMEHFEMTYDYVPEDDSKAYYMEQIYPNVLTINIQSSKDV